MGIRSLVSSTKVGSRRDGFDSKGSISGPSRSGIYPELGLYLLDYSQATFSRTTEAAFMDPRLDWRFVRTGFGTYQSFNHLSNHNNFVTGWSTNLSYTASVVTSPSGQSVDEIGDWNAAVLQITTRAVTASGSYSRFVLDFYLRKDNNETRFPEFGIDYSTEALRLQVNTKTGATAYRNSGLVGYENFTSSVSDAGDWWRVSLSRICARNATMRIAPATGKTLGGGHADATGSIIVSDLTVREDLHDAWKTANKPRIFDDGAVLIEGARTNALRSSDSLDTQGGIWVWFSSSATGSTIVSPDGLLIGDTVNFGAFSNASNTNRSSQANDISSSVSIWAKGEGQQFRLAIKKNDGSTFDYSVNKNTSGSLIRYDALLSHGSGAASNIAEFGIANASDGAARGLQFCGAQTETGVTFPSSYIRTTSAAATRGAESLTFPAGTYNAAVMVESGFEFDYYPNHSSDDSITPGYMILRGTQTAVRWAQPTVVRVNITGGTPIELTFGGLVFSRHQKLTFRVNMQNRSATLSGFTSGNATKFFTGSYDDGSSGILYIGRDSFGAVGANGVFSRLRRIR